MNSDDLPFGEVTPDIVKIDGNVMENADWKVHTALYEFDNNVHTVEVFFKTDGNTLNDERLYIQPNRYIGVDESIKSYTSPYSVELSNLKLEIVK